MNGKALHILVVVMLAFQIINSAGLFYVFSRGSIAFHKYVENRVPEAQQYTLLGNCEYFIEKLEIDDTPENCVAETYRRAQKFSGQ